MLYISIGSYSQVSYPVEMKSKPEKESKWQASTVKIQIKHD
jgi:hypothetical protein